MRQIILLVLKMFLLLLTIVLLTGGTICTPFLEILQTPALPLTEKCSHQLQEFVSNFSMDTNSWALKMLDATSKLPSGLLSLNFGEMGDFEQCINIDVENIHGKYCLGYLSLTTESNIGTASLGNIQTSMQQGPLWALCLPDGCTTNDANFIGNAVLQTLPIGGLGVSFSDMLCQTVKEVNPELTGGAIATIVILAILVLTVLVATLWDLYVIFYNPNNPCPLIVKGFSVYTNSQKVFKMSTPNPEQFPCLNGIKFISMMWVVAGHQFSIPMNGSITNSGRMIEWADSLYSMFFVSGTLSVDTFFTVGGVLMAYGFMKAKLKKVPFNIFLYYVHRYIRLTPPFAIVVLVSATLLEYMGSGPKWPFLVTYFQKNCQDYWWSALLYVQNYVNVTEMCVGQTWYLNIDMQLYIISPLIFYILWKYPKWCLLLLCLGSLTCIGLSFYSASEYELPAILSNLYSPNANDYQNKYYLLTHTRATPWIFGIILGYYIFKIKQNEMQFQPNRYFLWAMWGLSFGTLLACVLGGHSTLRSPEYDQWGNALHIALVRPAWSLAIAWIILACVTNNGGPINWILSLKIYQVLNRFTYSIYLTHVTLLYVIAYGRAWPDYFSDFNMAYQFWGTLWFSSGLAAFLVFTTESPMIIIEKILLGNAMKKPQKSHKLDVEKGTDNRGFEP